MNRIPRIFIASLLFIFLTSTAALPPNTFARQADPVTFYQSTNNSQGDAAFVPDPQAVPSGVNPLFLGLVDVHPVTTQPVPALASEWHVSDDGRTWTFTLRDDVPWVKWDPVAQETTVLRMVTAHDAAYAIQRACDPRLVDSFIAVPKHHIQGCAALADLPPNQVSSADYELVQARALDDTTLEIQLVFPAGYFLTLITSGIFHPVPAEIIETWGDDWTQPGTIVANGAFLLDENIPEKSWTLVRNPHLPDDLRGPGNVERVVFTVSESWDDELNLYDANQIDLLGLVRSLLSRIVGNEVYADEQRMFFTPSSLYIGFANDKPPFDNVHVRRAFSAAFQRDDWVATFYPWSGMPLIHLTPPGVFGAPPPDQVGVGYDPDYAREQLALGGYPDCAGFPEITFLIHQGGAAMAETIAGDWEEVLGCDSARVRVEPVTFAERSERFGPDSPPEFRPELYSNMWGADYPDANNFLGDLLSCDGINYERRKCSEIDDLIDQAAVESDPATRVALYREIEERLFGPDGEHPLMPGFFTYDRLLVKPWVDGPVETDFSFGAVHFDWYTIDQAAQLAARGQY